jgi:hypothetical protein
METFELLDLSSLKHLLLSACAKKELLPTELMKDEDMPLPEKRLSDFDWYISIGRNKRYYSHNDRGKRMKILSRDYPLCNLRAYKALINDLETQVMGNCQLLSRRKD